MSSQGQKLRLKTPSSQENLVSRVQRETPKVPSPVKVDPSSSLGAQQPHLLDLPCFNPENFSELRPSDHTEPSRWPSAAVCVPTSSRSLPPKSQVIATEQVSVLMRHLYNISISKLGKRGDGRDQEMTDRNEDPPWKRQRVVSGSVGRSSR